MTKQQFDNYKFSAKTEIKVGDKWHKIREVNFVGRYVILKSYVIYSGAIEDIRN